MFLLPQPLGGCANSVLRDPGAAQPSLHMAGSLRRCLPLATRRSRTNPDSTRSPRIGGVAGRMSCCGGKRAAFKSIPSPVTRPAVEQPSPNDKQEFQSQQVPTTTSASSFTSMAITYVEKSPILVRGPVTGQTYRFSAANPIQSVDVRDAAVLLRTRFFRQT